MKRTLKMTAAGLLLALAVAVPAGAAPAATSATRIDGYVARSATYSVVAPDAVLVKANVPWTLAITTASGTTEFAGGKTNGTTVSLPEDIESITLVVD